MDDRLASRGLRFNLRTVLVCVTFFALAIGWYTSMSQQRTRSAWLLQQLLNARSQIQLAESRAEMQADAGAGDVPMGKGVLSGAKLEGVSLRDAVIKGDASAFQKARFDRSDLSNASLTGGNASFQGTSFNRAILRNAKLTGAGSSFQLATFDGADLSGAVLTGNLQAMSLRNAKCVGMTIRGSFQGVNIGSAQFQHADLSALESQDLESCYFDAPPEYDANTKFPDRFDPVTHGWKKTEVTVEK